MQNCIILPYFSKKFNKPYVNLSRVSTKNIDYLEILRNLPNFQIISFKSFEKSIMLAYFSKSLTNHAWNFRAFGRKIHTEWNFEKILEIFDEYSIEKLNFYLFLGKVLAKNRASGINFIFLQQIFPVRGGLNPLTLCLCHWLDWGVVDRGLGVVSRMAVGGRCCTNPWLFSLQSFVRNIVSLSHLRTLPVKKYVESPIRWQFSITRNLRTYIKISSLNFPNERLLLLLLLLLLIPYLSLQHE